MRIASAIGEACLASIAVVSMSSMDLVPAPYNSVLFGGGAGLLAATAMALKVKHKKSQPIGAVGVLPGVPAEHRGRSPQRNRKAPGEGADPKKVRQGLAELVSCYAPASRAAILERLKPIIYELTPEIRSWSGDVRLRVYLLMQEMAPDLSDPRLAKASLGLLVQILSKGGESALEMARPMFQQKIVEMYGRPEYDDEPFLPRVMLMLEDYEQHRVENVMRDAIHVWRNGQFRAASEYLGFDELALKGMKGKFRSFIRERSSTQGTKGTRSLPQGQSSSTTWSDDRPRGKRTIHRADGASARATGRAVPAGTLGRQSTKNAKGLGMTPRWLDFGRKSSGKSCNSLSS